jgi:anti-sigma regulatory factor (Ser/Thr protein kinase)
VKRLYQSKHQKYGQQRRRKRKQRRRKRREEQERGKRDYRKYLHDEGYSKPEIAQLVLLRSAPRIRVHLDVPKICSFVQNPEEFITFLETLGTYIKQNKTVQLDFRSATILTPDAFTVLLSKIYDERFCPEVQQVLFRPPEKKSPTRLVWDNSGMAHTLTIRPKALRKIKQQGYILNFRSKEVATELTVKMIEKAMEMLYGEKRHCPPIRTVIGEITLNTVEHAAGTNDGQEMWFASIYYDKARETICFSIVDNGVGIFKTAKTRKLLELYGELNILGKNFGTERSQILQDIFKSKIRFPFSQTGLSYRGGGLRKVYKRSEQKLVSNLTVITNDVHAKVPDDDFRMMQHSFHGTFFYWEYSDANKRN